MRCGRAALLDPIREDNREDNIQSCLSGYRQHGDVCVHQVVRFHYVLRLRGRRLGGDHDHGADVLRQGRCTQEVWRVLRQSERHEVILCITSWFRQVHHSGICLHFHESVTWICLVSGLSHFIFSCEKRWDSTIKRKALNWNFYTFRCGLNALKSSPQATVGFESAS